MKKNLFIIVSAILIAITAVSCEDTQPLEPDIQPLKSVIQPRYMMLFPDSILRPICLVYKVEVNNEEIYNYDLEGVNNYGMTGYQCPEIKLYSKEVFESEENIFDIIFTVRNNGIYPLIKYSNAQEESGWSDDNDIYMRSFEVEDGAYPNSYWEGHVHRCICHMAVRNCYPWSGDKYVFGSRFSLEDGDFYDNLLVDFCIDYMNIKRKPYYEK